jgi:hypothetical protein
MAMGTVVQRFVAAAGGDDDVVIGAGGGLAQAWALAGMAPSATVPAGRRKSGGSCCGRHAMVLSLRGGLVRQRLRGTILKGEPLSTLKCI